MKTTVEKLIKAAKSLNAHINRGNTVNGSRSMDLLDKYEYLREEAKTEGVWEEFCHGRFYDVEHDAYDFFA